MARNKLEEAEYIKIASMFGLSSNDVRNAVKSYFDLIMDDAKTISLNTPKKIFSKSVFDTLAISRIRYIPYIGRIGPNYNRYLNWRANESKSFPMMLKPGKRNWMSKEEIEIIAQKLLSGQEYEKPQREKIPFDRVWLVGEEGKKQARQVIKKEK